MFNEHSMSCFVLKAGHSSHSCHPLPRGFDPMRRFAFAVCEKNDALWSCPLKLLDLHFNEAFCDYVGLVKPHSFNDNLVFRNLVFLLGVYPN